jgi:hypothetical protein
MLHARRGWKRNRLQDIADRLWHKHASVFLRQQDSPINHLGRESNIDLVELYIAGVGDGHVFLGRREENRALFQSPQHKGGALTSKGEILGKQDASVFARVPSQGCGELGTYTHTAKSCYRNKSYPQRSSYFVHLHPLPRSKDLSRRTFPLSMAKAPHARRSKNRAPRKKRNPPTTSHTQCGCGVTRKRPSTCLVNMSTLIRANSQPSTLTAQPEPDSTKIATTPQRRRTSVAISRNPGRSSYAPSGHSSPTIPTIQVMVSVAIFGAYEGVSDHTASDHESLLNSTNGSVRLWPNGRLQALMSVGCIACAVEPITSPFLHSCIKPDKRVLADGFGYIGLAISVGVDAPEFRIAVSALNPRIPLPIKVDIARFLQWVRMC